MATLLVLLPPWLVDQHVLGEPVPARWRRIGDEAGFEVRTVPADAPRVGDVVVDGRVLTIGSSHLREVLRDRRSLVLDQTPEYGDDQTARDELTVPRLDLDDLHRHAGLVVVAPGAAAEHVGRRDPIAPSRALDPWRHAPILDALGLRALEGRELGRRHEAELKRGVRFVGPAPFLGPRVLLAPGCEIWGGCTLLGATRVEAGAIVRQGCVLTDSVVDIGAEVRPYTVAERAVIGPDAVVGPFAHLRPGTRLDAASKVGNFVETKNARLGPGAKANHLSYVGDADVGAGANLGAGMITCNYDGGRKHRTTVGAGAFVGTNSSLVAPVSIGPGALVAAGSVVTDDVPGGALALGRARQTTIADRGARILEANRRARADEKAEEGQE